MRPNIRFDKAWLRMDWFWQLNQQTRMEVVIASMSFICAVSGFWSGNVLISAAASTCVLLIVARWSSRLTRWINELRAGQRAFSDLSADDFPARAALSAENTLARPGKRPQSATALIDRFLENGRWALLLRSELAAKLNRRQRESAEAALVQKMAAIKPGRVWLTSPTKDEIEMGAPAGLSADVGEIYFDRFAVSNQEFQKFVADGGYENTEFWCEVSRPVRGEFVDTTGKPGPRFWANGHFALGEGDFPVVGISWYEAQAYCRWAGKRLPVGPEWVKAASAPIATATAPGQQRKYPWGESVGPTQANLWQSGIGRCTGVTDYAQHAQHGICQMIGNVWEWVDDDFTTWSGRNGWEATSLTLKSIRGGAFDTYLENQATNQSQSGEDPFARRHNVGFRCVIDKRALHLSA